MAYVPQAQNDEDKRKAQTAGTELGSFSGQTGTQAPTQPKFTNVADYLNKNPEGSANIGQAASDKLSAQRDEASGSVLNSSDKFTQDVNAGKVDLDQNVLDSGLNDSTNFVKDPNNVAKFTAMRDAAYKGPSSLQSTDYFAPTQSKVTGLGTTATGLGTEAGRNALVGSLSDHPTQGKTSLNQLLLQGNDAAAKKIQDTAGTFKSVEDQWAKLLAEAPEAANAARAATDATRATTQQKLGETTGAFKTGINDKLAKATNERDAFNLNYQNIDNKLNGQYDGSDLTQRELDDLGISGASPYLAKLHEFNGPNALSYYGQTTPLSGHITDRGSAITNTPTYGGVASAEDYAREAALQQLSGNDLGLADTQENPYAANGRLQNVDYMGAFQEGGQKLQSADEGWRPQQDGSDTNMLYNIQARRGITSGNPTSGAPTNDYYTSPSAGATPGAGYEMAPPPAGWDPNTPAPYGAPTSNPPAGLVNPRWNAYTGQWEGAQLAPNPTPGSPGTGPGNGGGHHTF